MVARNEHLMELALTGGVADRDAAARKDPGLVGRLRRGGRTRVVEVCGDQVLVTADKSLHVRPLRDGDAASCLVYLGLGADKTPWMALLHDGDPGPAPDAGAWVGLRQVGTRWDATSAGIAASAIALSLWHRRHVHCPRCGGPTRPEQSGWVRVCTADGSEHYPRTDPAVIMAVTGPDDRLLLARGTHSPRGWHTTLAGFVEPGETLEAAVAREVAEEVGLTVTRVEYRGSQPWPFPGQLMVGFAARVEAGELRLQPDEIADARWFTRDGLDADLRAGRVRVPGRLSISRRLIENWFGGPLPHGPRA